jgi:hypothetical protein
MAALRALWDVADPMPSGLVDRVQFGLEPDPDGDVVDVEVSRLVEMTAPVAARSDEFTRLVTFQSDSLTIMVMLERAIDGTTRIDGWLTPGAVLRIELRCPAGPMSTDSDGAGRFSLDAVPTGAVRLIVHDAGRACRIITPTIELGGSGP